MRYNTMGTAEARVSALGFGCMRFPTLQDGGIDREKATALIHRAYKGGINYFDTAYAYHGGESETLVGEALSAFPRDSYYLATKLPTWLCHKPEDVQRLLEEQLQRLGTDYVDFYLLHSLDRARWQEQQSIGTLQILEKLKEQGKIRHICFSYHGDFDTFCQVVDSYPWAFAQIQINYLDYRMNDARAFHQKLCGAGIPCVVMEPVRGGFLAQLPAELEKKLRHYDAGVSSAAWALRWCLRQENMPLVLSGMSNGEQLEENLALFSLGEPLSPAQTDVLESVCSQLLELDTIACTGCNYCENCPSEVYIPMVFNVYNQLVLFQNEKRSRGEYAQFIGGHDFSLCTGCGACTAVCPQGLEIPQLLEQAHRALTNSQTGS